LVGCSRQAELAQGWTQPVKVAESSESLNDPLLLRKRHDTILALQWRSDMEARYFVRRNANNSSSWNEVPLTGVARGYWWAYPAIDQSSDRVFFDQGYMEADELKMSFLVGHMTGGVAVQDVMERKLVADKKTLFGETSPGVRLNEPGTRDYPELGVGIIGNSDLNIPYCLAAVTVTSHSEDGPFHNGVFHSSDSGTTWRIERISDFAAWLPSICKTKAYYYFFAVKNYQRDLWFSRKSAENGSWTAPEVVTKTFCNSALYWRYVATAENDTVHVCWLDRRHEKTRRNQVYPNRENYEVAYCHRKDSDAGWSKDIILSEGLLYTYSPTMSVEGDKVVVAWAGVQTAPDWHKEHAPNDVYYVTSNDSGKTWTKPLKVTDGVKDGITSGAPQVMLLNGVIYLSYIQGKISYKEESHGLVKLNQPPWPIYYQQRPFPD
jgi:hypothetical protein